MNSQELQQAQDTIESLIINEVKQPLKDFAKIRKYLDLLKDIDSKRREAWNKEKFGVYESFTDNVIGLNSDDIPF
jgi:hypothetical protein